ncbi:YkyA family protein [Bacillus testis]|uniref:YkyA family protein n=1 Tax=Bacillus testis TaxID=1622072 RepID=UPI00067EAA1E|nr:YkyA family protein [Bacillus testis]
MGNKIWILLFISLFILAGCREPENSNEIQQLIKNTDRLFVEAEVPQSSLAAIEKEENEYYSELISLDKRRAEEIGTAVAKLEDSLKSREEMMKIEENMVKKARKAWEKGRDFHAANQEEEEKARRLWAVGLKRFQAHGLLMDSYKKSIKADRKLYRLFSKKNASITDLQNAIESVNGCYKKVIQYNEEYNRATGLYVKEKNEYLLEMETEK